MKHTYFRIPGWFNMHEAYDQALEVCEDGDTIVEIGSFMGRSTNYLATNIVNSEKDVKIIAVDTFKGSSEHGSLNIPKDFSAQFKENCRFFVNREIIIMKQGRSDDPAILDSIPDNSVKVVIVDGAHEYEAVKEDIMNWWPKVKEDGYMIGDDIMLPAVKQAAEEAAVALKIEGLTYLQGYEQWFLASKGDYSNIMKLVPGTNCLK